MPVKPRGSTFQAYFVFNKKRYRRSFPTQEQAEAWEEQSKRQLTEGLSVETAPKTPAGIDMKTLQAKVFDRYWRGTRSEAHARINSDDVANLIGYEVPVSSVTQLTIDYVVSELKRRNLSNATINRKLSALSKMLKFAEDRGWIDRRPKIERLRENTHRIRWMTNAEEETVLKTCRFLGFTDLADLVVVLTDTGMRLSEALKLHSKDIDSGMIRVWQNKADYPRSVPMTKRVREVVERRSGDGELFPKLTFDMAQHQWQRVRDIVGMAGDDQFVLHMLRHTCASRLVQRGVSLPVVKEFLGHKSIQTTMRYAHLAPRHLMDAVSVLEPATESGPSLSLAK
ncbi:site-specific integrase [Planctomycetales bacterium ZRK34]|nr:site-specific integrase [Planctomycetales bacterium ZRK34]